MPAQIDKNKNRVDDAIDDQVTSAQAILRKRGAGTEELRAARSVLEEPVGVEFLFAEQITQQQIDEFLAAGGSFSKVYEAISFGWTGSLPRGKAADVATSMGASLLGIIESKPIELHLDEATRTGRVRPVVWNAGVKGDGTGTDRVTVAILDTGVDGTHTDLAGRMEYWKDWTPDGHLTAQDAGHHGSHVAGIAVGSGAAYMASPSLLKYTDTGQLASTGFFPSPIHIPASVSSVNWNTALRWQTGVGLTAAHFGQVYRDGGYGGVNVVSTNVSPASTSASFPNPYNGSTFTYTGYAAKGHSSASSPYYANNHAVTYTGPGDGYSALSGVSPESRWAGFKVFTDAGTGNTGFLYNALDDLVANKLTYNIKVANMSLGITATGGPGLDSTLRDKTNTAAANGIVVVCSAGNTGNVSAGGGGEVSDPGRAHHAITVVSTSDVNQVTDYSSHGFSGGGDSSSGDEDMKPDIGAPGGSVNHQSNILAVDSNTGDKGPFSDGVANDYANYQGTSMASPFLAGCAALVIDAMQRAGIAWNYTLADALRVKSVLLMTATETNIARETSASGSPSLQRGGKDINEGYGIVNADAAVEAFLNVPLTAEVMAGDSFASGAGDRRCWARRVALDPAKLVNLQLDPGSGDYDVYIYSATPNTYGNPVILTSSVNGGLTDEVLTYTPTTSEIGYLVVKRVSGNGAWTMSGAVPVGVSQFSLE